MKSLFTDEQWHWVKERIDEGYSMEALSKFLGINRNSIRVALIRQGFYPALKSELPQLADRRKEFLSLREEGQKSKEPETKAGCPYCSLCRNIPNGKGKQ